MTVLAPTSPTCPSTGAECVPVPPGPRRRRDARRRRRDAARADRAAAARAGLYEIRTVLVQAQALLGQGWVQGTWFAARPSVGTVVSTGTGAPPAACLVGAVVLAAGGRDAVRTPSTQRSLDLLWHCLHRASEPGLVRWLPSPALRTLQVQDLTRWNDTPGRSLDDVLALVDAAIGRLTTELGGRAPAQVTPAAVH